MRKVKKEKISVAVYIRVAYKGNDDIDVRIQKALIDCYLRIKRNKNIVDYYIDYGYSGMNLNRPAFKKMLQDLKNKKFDEIVVKDLARISRNYLDLNDCIENYFKANGIKIISIEDDIEFQKRLRNFYLLNNSKEVE